MKKSLAFSLLLLSIILLQHCKGTVNTGPSFTETSDTLTFFPVNIYLRGQIHRVDSLSSTIYKVLINGSKKDSVIITKQEFAILAQPFLEYDISSKQLHRFYKENVFADQTTQSVTFNYTAMVDTLPLRSIDVLMDSTGQQIKNIFISKEKLVGDSTVTEKIGWKNDERFFINRSIQKGNNAATMQRIMVVWRF